MNDQLSFLAPHLSRGHVPPGIVPSRDKPSARCWTALRGEEGLVRGLWPVSRECPATIHNTLYAARKPKGTNCTCPRAVALKEDFNLKDRARRGRAREARQAGQREAGVRRYRARPVTRVPAPETAAFLPWSDASGAVAACRVQSLGGPLEDAKAADFFNEDSSKGGVAARERALARCERCPLIDPCLSAALARDERNGIWGGKTPMQRAAMIRRGVKA